MSEQPRQPNQLHQQYDQTQRSNVPIPDPSILTTEALEREIGHVRELFRGQLEDIVKDLARFQNNHDERHRDVVDAAISHLKELCDVKFGGIQQQFLDRDLRFAQGNAAADEAIKAALASAEKAVAKSEATFTKEIDSIKALISTTAKAQDQQIRDIKDEQTGSRGKGAGINATWALVMTLAPILISIVGVAIVIASR
jgi:hypothetical protein